MHQEEGGKGDNGKTNGELVAHSAPLCTKSHDSGKDGEHRQIVEQTIMRAPVRAKNHHRRHVRSLRRSSD